MISRWMRGQAWEFRCALLALAYRPVRGAMTVGVLAVAICTVALVRSLTERQVTRAESLVSTFEQSYLLAFRGYSTWVDLSTLPENGAGAASGVYPFLLLPFVFEEDPIPIAVAGYPSPWPPELSQVIHLSGGALGQEGAAVEVGLARRLGAVIGDRVTLFERPVGVTAIYRREANFVSADIYVPLTTLQSLTGLSHRASFLLIRPAGDRPAPEAIGEIRAALPELRVLDLGAVRDRLTRVSEPARAGARALTMVSGIMAGLIVLFSTLSSVQERHPEHAVLRTMGASASRVTTGILFEGAILFTLGAPLGALLAQTVSLLGLPRLHPALGGALEPGDLARAIAIVLGASLLGLVIPAARAARASPWSLFQ